MATPTVYLGDVQKRPRIFRVWEQQRNKREVHWLMECVAEMIGVFFYVFSGVGSSAALALGTATHEGGLSSILQVGFAYAFGIMFALGVSAPTSGGHLSPCISISMVIFRGFPIGKAIRYIIAQILGAYIACMLVYYQWRPFLDEIVAGMIAAGEEAAIFTPTGPAGPFALYQAPGMPLGTVFLNEFVCCVFVGLVIWAALDPTNHSIPPALGPFVIGMAFAVCVWGFSTPGIALNTARDVGGRLWALSVWGLPAAGGKYAAIMALTNIPATIFAIGLYEFFLTDSDRLLTPQALEVVHVTHNHRRLGGQHVTSNHDTLEGRTRGTDEKAHFDTFEVETKEQV